MKNDIDEDLNNFIEDEEYRNALEDSRLHVGHIYYDVSIEEMKFMIDMDFFKDPVAAVDMAQDIVYQAEKLKEMCLDILRVKNGNFKDW